MNKWIGGIVNAGGESVKVWNIIGEPLDKPWMPTPSTGVNTWAK